MRQEDPTNIRSKKTVLFLASLGLIASMTACGPGAGEATPTRTATPTATPVSQPPGVAPTPTPTPALPPAGASPTPASPCDGLSGEIEVRVLVGPADAVGLEPVAVGSVPFSVTSGEEPYTVQGAGHVAYDALLTEEWGTYEVTLNLDITVVGECVEGTGLDVTLDMAGNQYVEVNAEGFHGEYPWEGEQSFNLIFPLEDGATVEGEGWAFVLHLN